MWQTIRDCKAKEILNANMTDLHVQARDICVSQQKIESMRVRLEDPSKSVTQVSSCYISTYLDNPTVTCWHRDDSNAMIEWKCTLKKKNYTHNYEVTSIRSSYSCNSSNGRIPEMIMYIMFLSRPVVMHASSLMHMQLRWVT